MNSSKWMTLAAVAALSWQLVPSVAQAGKPGPGAASQDPVVVQAHPMHEVLERRVPYTDLDLSKPEGLETLFQRIDMAVQQVCPATDIRDFRVRALQRECETAANAQAMAQVDRLIAERVASR